MKPVPLYLCEEHHEAFLAWHHARAAGSIGRMGHCLLHVDWHADMRCPQLEISARAASRSLAAARDLTYGELGIASFIIPAAFLGIVSDICWLHPQAAADGPVQRQYVRSLREEGRHFIVCQEDDAWEGLKKPWEDRAYFQSRVVSLKGSLAADHPVFLDIDLDFFSCQIHPRGEWKIEITREEFERIRADRYHFLKLRQHCRAVQADGGYFLDFDRNTAASGSGGELTEAQILTRMNALTDFLRANAVEPVLISVCRSVRSGYTPPGEAQFIERQLLSRLGDMFPLESRPIENVLAGIVEEDSGVGALQSP